MVKKGIYIEALSIFWTLIEAGVAIGAGIAAHSLVLTAFGADSIIELIAGFVLLWRLWLEMKRQPFRKVKHAEKFASWVVGISLILLAFYIVVSAIYNLFSQNSAETSLLGIALALISGIIMPVIAFAKRNIGTRIRSKALVADSCCSMVCAYMSWVLIVGVVSNAVLKLWWIDSFISLVLVYFVLKEGLEALHEAGRR
ncbi:MAG: cation transporter [Bacillota bacterium]|nr:cation transporter [Bacillota bacterium]